MEGGPQPGIHPHNGVRDAHDLAELLVGGVVDRDVVVERLAHLLDAVGADQKWHGQHSLGRLAARTLQLTADQVVERLIGAPDFDVGVDLHRIDALQ
jgi:hypothetical protein